MAGREQGIQVLAEIPNATGDLLRNEYKRKGRQVVTYDLQFDRDRFRDILKKKDEKETTQLQDYTKLQLRTLLGERFHVGLSEISYDIKNGEIYGQGTNEPFMQMLKRGRDYRKLHGAIVDHPREQAEVDGFEKVQNVLGKETTPLGTMMVSISPPGVDGSVYKHNFYDIHSLQKNEKGEKYIKTMRYSSNLEMSDYYQFMGKVTGKSIPPQKDVAAFFLANPIKIENSTPEEIHTYLHRNHESFCQADFEEIIRICTPFILTYIRVLKENPDDVSMQGLTFNALLNKADQVADLLKNGSLKKGEILTGKKQGSIMEMIRMPSLAEIRLLGNKKVREVTTGCGSSGGAEVASNTSPFGVVDAARQKVGESNSQEWFTCPKCNWKADGPIGNGPCGGCGLTKEQFAEESGILCE